MKTHLERILDDMAQEAETIEEIGFDNLKFPVELRPGSLEHSLHNHGQHMAVTKWHKRLRDYMEWEGPPKYALDPSEFLEFNVTYTWNTGVSIFSLTDEGVKGVCVADRDWEMAYESVGPALSELARVYCGRRFKFTPSMSFRVLKKQFQSLDCDVSDRSVDLVWRCTEPIELGSGCPENSEDKSSRSNQSALSAKPKNYVEIMFQYEPAASRKAAYKHMFVLLGDRSWISYGTTIRDAFKGVALMAEAYILDTYGRKIKFAPTTDFKSAKRSIKREPHKNIVVSWRSVSEEEPLVLPGVKTGQETQDLGFRPGDVVRLKSDPVHWMTVERVDESENALCSWFNEELKTEQNWFKFCTLTRGA